MQRPGEGPEGPRIDAALVAVPPEEAPRPTEAELGAVEHYFGDRAELAQRYVGHLASSGIERGLLGPREIPRLWSRHVLNCAAVADAIPQGALVADIGSGAGLPGIVLALSRPDLMMVLVEPLERRCQWLDEVVEDLGLESRVDVVRARAEQMVGQIDADVVTARAVTALRTLVPLTLPLISGTGELVALKGRSAELEIEKAQKIIRKYKGHDVRVETLGEGFLEEPTTVVRIAVG
ncbi:16S rRNA (guanine(527)-N(7))-methyltransferase RsmG [Galactobacter caseinivorans]|uniref:Ribosomal RNA small subunit methyltransferase G n=2 Tax=Galactobacter caseinivorans TaxID=2676123 RepID=A0A496PJ73_9MICC|nr:16S rRNA (guanine(527)-N(7))-methyltransferase RsmG [Galactobacter caseinivorans]